jgi:hypothetical protein
LKLYIFGYSVGPVRRSITPSQDLCCTTQNRRTKTFICVSIRMRNLDSEAKLLEKFHSLDRAVLNASVHLLTRDLMSQWASERSCMKCPVTSSVKQTQLISISPLGLVLVFYFSTYMIFETFLEKYILFYDLIKHNLLMVLKASFLYNNSEAEILADRQTQNRNTSGLVYQNILVFCFCYMIGKAKADRTTCASSEMCMEHRALAHSGQAGHLQKCSPLIRKPDHLHRYCPLIRKPGHLPRYSSLTHAH